MVKILIVEDNNKLRKLIDVYLTHNGYKTYNATDGLEALNIINNNMIDLVICDIMMPNMDGFELIKELREIYTNLPILIVTAKESKEDKILGFKLGSDDYMVKPIDLEELLMRVKALLRRANINNEHKLTIGDVVLDYDKLTVTKGNEKIELPQKEFYLLYKLLSYPNKIFTRMQLMDDIWGMDVKSDEQTVNVHIRRLREKFSNYNEFEIVTVRGLGYKAVRKDD
ncbi:Two component transcriptional regulator, winged helix family [Clostridium bornimense]|uniref:Heme response regulator HssR n=2 Tax=Clostridium TaxID=1485 RepID=W6S010_9CLOT|nr:response regulator transcription factor [Clostridium bornimense]CDM70058.1 Two component transcriptional regulator, winged helix family [Clostridium bornimense]